MNCSPKEGEMNCNTQFSWDDKSDYKLGTNREVLVSVTWGGNAYY